MKTIALLVLVIVAASIAWFIAGRGEGPVIGFEVPTEEDGQIRELFVVIDTPGGKLASLEVLLVQGVRRMPLFSLPGDDAALLISDNDRRLRLRLVLGKQRIPRLDEGAARIIVTAERPVLFGCWQLQSTASRDIAVRLARP